MEIVDRAIYMTTIVLTTISSKLAYVASSIRTLAQPHYKLLCQCFYPCEGESPTLKLQVQAPTVD